MYITIDNCIDCPSMGLPCQGDICPNKPSQVLVCDECEAEEQLYRYGIKELCTGCVLKQLEAV